MNYTCRSSTMLVKPVYIGEVLHVYDCIVHYTLIHKNCCVSHIQIKNIYGTKFAMLFQCIIIVMSNISIHMRDVQSVHPFKMWMTSSSLINIHLDLLRINFNCSTIMSNVPSIRIVEWSSSGPLTDIWSRLEKS